MNIREAMQRIMELERRVRELEARPLQQIHYHYGYPSLSAPQPQYPRWPQYPLEVTCRLAADA